MLATLPISGNALLREFVESVHCNRTEIGFYRHAALARNWPLPYTREHTWLTRETMRTAKRVNCLYYYDDTGSPLSQHSLAGCPRSKAQTPHNVFKHATHAKNHPHQFL